MGDWVESIEMIGLWHIKVHCDVSFVFFMQSTFQLRQLSGVLLLLWTWLLLEILVTFRLSMFWWPYDTSRSIIHFLLFDVRLIPIEKYFFGGRRVWIHVKVFYVIHFNLIRGWHFSWWSPWKTSALPYEVIAHIKFLLLALRSSTTTGLPSDIRFALFERSALFLSLVWLLARL